jgi:hypothetical protein
MDNNMTRINLAAVILGLAATFGPGVSSAQDCAISYTRTACPGKNAESYAKCDGKQSCVKQVVAESPEACQAAALKACANDRLDITKNKVIGAQYKGQPLKSTQGADDFCQHYEKRAAEFDKCGG